MADAIETSVHVEGLKDLEDMLLKHLPVSAGFKVLREAMFKAALPVVKSAKANAPKGTGALAASIGRFSKRGKHGDRAMTLYVGPKIKNKEALALANAGRDEPIGGIFYGHMVERGTRKARARPYLRPAMDANADRVVAAFGVQLKTSIEKAVIKHRRG